MSDPYGYSQPYPVPAAPPAAPLERPKSVTYAVVGMWVGGLLSVVSSLFLFTMDTTELKTQLVTEMEKQPTYDPTVLDAQEMADVFVPIMQVGGAVLGLIALGLWIWMAVTNGKGRNWARITATVFGGLSLLGSLSTVANLAGSAALGGAAMPMSTANIVLAVVDPLLVVAILVLLWLPSSSAYFGAVGAARRQQRTGYAG
ncbi:hypothetical protein [Nocardioides albus]|uniref:Uncharacterized protein n=1 Tax=Nocardioides albus TaxID=1841 RepID=A0A7W5A6L0_9ACTN|nr:hypothetical protein [Nocardioides albus]MBB3090562.1 hypothetical protein [Nocardioides albus]GGU24764.1 hypothetical protein GCM10007979_24460 [Nocardioides albus]